MVPSYEPCYQDTSSNLLIRPGDEKGIEVQLLDYYEKNIERICVETNIEPPRGKEEELRALMAIEFAATTVGFLL